MWLSDCGLIHKVSRANAAGMPLRAYEDLNAFKLFVLDVGLLGCMAGLRQCKRACGNRTIKMNRELTAIHEEVINNLDTIHGVLLCMNRSIQSEGTFGIIKWDRSYKRLFRRGIEAVILELTLISCGFNLYKYHNKKNRAVCYLRKN